MPDPMTSHGDSAHRSETAAMGRMGLGLDGKVALVTGASRGIGAAIAQVLALEGVDLFLVARGQPDVEAVARHLQETTRRTVGAGAADLRDPASAERVVGAAVEAFGRLDILVNCAGDTRSKAFFDAADDDWLDAFGVKFHGTVRMCRSAWPHLRAAGGCIVNIAGNTARSARADLAINGAVNSALLHLTRSLADVGRREGVRVNAISPGRTMTRRLDRALDRIVDEEVVSREDAARALLESSGIPRFCDPREIGWLAAYLVSSRADFIQGAIVEIDGGETRAI
jgi:NAD(P)-dependent dehydrogenase (short-subunit alcohol dehydrogenase family)